MPWRQSTGRDKVLAVFLLGVEIFQFGRMAIHAGLFSASGVEAYSSLCGHLIRSFWIGIFNSDVAQALGLWGFVVNESHQPLFYFV